MSPCPIRVAKTGNKAFDIKYVGDGKSEVTERVGGDGGSRLGRRRELKVLQKSSEVFRDGLFAGTREEEEAGNTQTEQHPSIGRGHGCRQAGKECRC